MIRDITEFFQSKFTYCGIYAGSNVKKTLSSLAADEAPTKEIKRINYIL